MFIQDPASALKIPSRVDIPISAIFFNTFISIWPLSPPAVCFCYTHTWGLKIRAVGEHPIRRRAGHFGGARCVPHLLFGAFAGWRARSSPSLLTPGREHDQRPDSSPTPAIVFGNGILSRAARRLLVARDAFNSRANHEHRHPIRAMSLPLRRHAAALILFTENHLPPLMASF
jgi:hypothetical protein